MTDPGDLAAIALRLVAAAGDDGEANPELLPVRLAQACAQALGVDGAGLSLFIGDAMRVPIGASDDDAGLAERLQFTLGEGPCFTAHHDGAPSCSTDEVLMARWPLYHQELTVHTGYHGVVCMPLRRGMQGMAALDLYFRSPEFPVDLQWDQVELAAELISELLTDMPHDRTGDQTPPWLQNPFVDRRATVWVAIGMLNAGLNLNSPDALATLRAYSYGHDRTVDDTADDLIHRRIPVSAVSDR